MAKELHDDVRQKSDLCEVDQRELSHEDQLANRTAELHRILLSNISWYGLKSVPLQKPSFIHGDQIDAPINYVSDFVSSNMCMRLKKKL